MAVVLEAITHVGYGGRIIAPGEVFSADDDYAEKLIKGKSAKVAKSLEKEVAPKTTRRRKVDTNEKDV